MIQRYNLVRECSPIDGAFVGVDIGPIEAGDYCKHADVEPLILERDDLKGQVGELRKMFRRLMSDDGRRFLHDQLYSDLVDLVTRMEQDS